MMTTQRFVSLHGFFSVNYPQHWIQETDEHGQYLLYNPNGGSGVVRVIVLDNEFTGDDAAIKVLEQIYTLHIDFSPSIVASGNNRFVHYIKEHEVNNSMFTVYYWVTAKTDKVVLLTYTVQTAMKELEAVVAEKIILDEVVASFEFIQSN
jgi:hypothetical protein